VARHRGRIDAGLSSLLSTLGSGERPLGLQERVLDSQVVEFLAVFEVFGVEDAAIGFEGGGYEQGVVPGERAAAGQFESLPVKGVGRGNC
jgi:hypothetical protein